MTTPGAQLASIMTGVPLHIEEPVFHHLGWVVPTLVVENGARPDASTYEGSVVSAKGAWALLPGPSGM